MDQFIVENPDYFFSRSPEHCRINPDNLLILLHHIKSAAFELPFEKGERFGGENLEELLDYLEEKGVLHRVAEPLALVGGKLSRRRGQPPEHQPGKYRRRRYDGGGKPPRHRRGGLGQRLHDASTITPSTWWNPTSTMWTNSIWKGKRPMSARSMRTTTRTP